MRLDALLPRSSDGCVDCPPTPQCNCGTKQCFLISRSCTTCASITCVDTSANGSAHSGGVSKGALAGAIIGVLIFLALAVCAFLWYRRRNNNRAGPVIEVKPDIPASAETVLNRPDPNASANEKPVPPSQPEPTVRVYSSSNLTIDLDPQSQNSPLHSPSRHSTQSNPFSDSHSIQTAGTESTNVIPIHLVSPESHSTSDSVPTTSAGPVRPSRSPDLNLDHVNVSRDSIRPGNNLAAPSMISGISSRNSYMSNASFSSDFLNEAPMIITPVKGSVRVVKAEVISTGSLSPVSAEGPRPMSRPPTKSPLASQSFGPADVVKEEDEHTADPFHDGLSPSPQASVTTFGHSSDMRTSTASDLDVTLPWMRAEGSRPSSMDTQAGSVVDIGSATRVNVGLATPLTANSFPRSPFRTTMGRLVTPNTAITESLEEQQQRALDTAQARTNAQGGALPTRRISNSSVLSATSTRADSILESFPFVPPSPISDRPMRSPSAGQQSFPQSSPRRAEFKTQPDRESVQSDLPAPPNRRTLGMSTASQFSTASSGLGSFPFQIDSGNSTDSAPPVPFNGRQRASLDTLALTSDLSSYPLGFDRDSVAIPLPQRDSDTLPPRDRKI